MGCFMSHGDMDNVIAVRLFNCNKHLLNGWTFEQFVRDPMYALITAQFLHRKRLLQSMRQQERECSTDYDLVFLRKQAD